MLSTPRRRWLTAMLSMITVLVGVSVLAAPHEDTPRAAAQPICIPNPYVSCPPPPGQQPGDPGLPPITGGPPIPTPPLITPFVPTSAPGPQVGANSAPALPPYDGTPIMPVPGDQGPGPAPVAPVPGQPSDAENPPGPLIPGAPTPAPNLLPRVPADGSYPVNEVEFETTDKCGNKVILRRGYYNGKQGFGWDKINHKHKITSMDVVQQMVESTCGEPDPSAPGTLIYRKTITMKDCSWLNANEWICSNTDNQVTLRAVVQTENPQDDGKQKGMITAYCEGMVECPSWVSREGFIGTFLGLPIDPDDPDTRPTA